MNHISAGFDRGQIIRNPKAAILMPMPIHLDVTSLDSSIRYHLILNESQQFANPIRSNMTTRITNTDAISA